MAQRLTVRGVCRRAGLHPKAILSLDRPTPVSFAETFAVATDDVLVSSRGARGASGLPGVRLDKAMVSLGVVKNPCNDLDEVADREEKEDTFLCVP